MKKLFVFVLAALVLVSAVIAADGENNNFWRSSDLCENNPECNNGIRTECKNFYNGDTHYYAIAKWEYNEALGDYAFAEGSSLYNYFNLDVTGTLEEADWSSNVEVVSVLVKSGNERVAFDGGLSGTVNSSQNIGHITFCGYRTSNGGGNGGGNGVPEFPAWTLGIAVLVVALGLVFIRKN
jgi:hypothetical protein